MSKRPLPPSKLPADTLRQLRQAYIDLVGFVPPRIEARTDLLARVDPDGLHLQEQARRHFMYPACFDTKTSQLMLFGMLLVQLADAARLHAIAARREGASWDELSAVVGLAFLFRGLSAANLGSEILQGIAKEEATSTS